MSDYISRQDAIEDVKGWMPYDAHENYIFDQVLEWVKTFPSADVRENVHGEWGRHYSRPNVLKDVYWHCSVCGVGIDIRSAFCPNCGADMRKEALSHFKRFDEGKKSNE